MTSVNKPDPKHMHTIKLYGSDWCPDCRRAENFLKEHNISYDAIDIELDKEATATVEAINYGKRIIPTILINGKSLTNPSNDSLAVTLGISKAGTVLFFGTAWCPDCRRAKSYLDDNNINYQYVDIDHYDWATQEVEKINRGKRIIPTLIINEEPYTNPDNALLKEVLGIDVKKEHKVFDTIIIGGGAAGLTTSIYAQRDRLDSLILEKTNIGGNAFVTEKIENYPGFHSISGPQLMDRMEEQAKGYGAIIKTGEEVINIEKKHELFHIYTKGDIYKGKTVVLATGSTYRQLGIPNESELIGAGVHYCATCEVAFYKSRDVIVIGGGNSAIEEGIFLAEICKSVKIISSASAFTASETYLEKLPSINNIKGFMNKTSIGFETNDKGLFEGVKVKDNITNQEEIITGEGAFIFIGFVPNTGAFENIVDLNERGFIKTNGLAETSVKGIFSAGDCREGSIAQVAAATGEGILASYGIKDYLKEG